MASLVPLGALQVREKVSAEWGLLALLMSGFTAILASAIPAMKASTIATPSLLRKWRPSEKEEPEDPDQPWVLDLPVKLRPVELETFLEFILEALRERSVPSIEYVSDLRLEEDRARLARLRFKWIRSDQAESMWSQNELVISRDGGQDYFNAKIFCRPHSNLREAVVDSVSLVRKIILEWNALEK